jgi:WD40-like Beta Propeller Repeat
VSGIGVSLEFSPDGRWIAYQSYVSGRWEVYVQPFPAVDTGRWQVSSGGGSRPLWSANGKELFYIAESGALMAVPVESGAAFAMGKPAALFAVGGYATGTTSRNYDIALDGRKFLFVKRHAPSQGIAVVTNWFDDVRRRWRTAQPQSRNDSIAERSVDAGARADRRARSCARTENRSSRPQARQHPGIVTIHDIAHADGVDYIVMEYVDGLLSVSKAGSDLILIENFQ